MKQHGGSEVGNIPAKKKKGKTTKASFIVETGIPHAYWSWKEDNSFRH